MPPVLFLAFLLAINTTINYRSIITDMIVNPLTGKHIKANGKLAQKLLKMHRDKEVKLKRGDVKLIKDGGQQHGGTECLDIDESINNLPKDVVDDIKEIMEKDAKFLAKLSCFSKEYLTKYNNLLGTVGIKSDNAKIQFVYDTFGVKTLEYINTNVKVKNMIAKFTLSQNDEGKIYDSFIQYIFDGDTKKQEPPNFDDYWVLKHINICCDPERIYWILQKIAQHNDSAVNNGGKRSYLQLSDLPNTVINNILIDDKQEKQTVVGNVMPNLLARDAAERNLAYLYTRIGNLTLNEVINFLKAIDIKRKVHIGL